MKKRVKEKCEHVIHFIEEKSVTFKNLKFIQVFKLLDIQEETIYLSKKK